jgi:hypothetical protein
VHECALSAACVAAAMVRVGRRERVYHDASASRAIISSLSINNTTILLSMTTTDRPYSDSELRALDAEITIKHRLSDVFVEHVPCAHRYRVKRGGRKEEAAKAAAFAPLDSRTCSVCFKVRTTSEDDRPSDALIANVATLDGAQRSSATTCSTAPGRASAQGRAVALPRSDDTDGDDDDTGGRVRAAEAPLLVEGGRASAPFAHHRHDVVLPTRPTRAYIVEKDIFYAWLYRHDY